MRPLAFPLLISVLALAFAVQLTTNHGSLPSLTASSEDESEVKTALNPAEVLCGPASLHIGMSLLGVPISLDEIVADCTVTRQGVSFGDLEQCAAQHGVSRGLKQMTWNDLQASDSVCVLFVDNAHYVTVDARKSTGQTDMVRCFDPGEAGKWVSRDGLEKRWQGETLRLDTPHNDPPVRFESLWHDIGFVSSDTSEFRVQLTNLSDTDRSINVVGTSCSCTTASLGTELLHPNEHTFLEASLSLSGKRGPFQERVLVSWAPGEKPAEVWFCGGRYAEALCRPREYIGEVVAGDSFRRELYVHDPGVGALSPEQLSCRTRLRLSETDHEINCAVEIEQITETDRAVGLLSRYRIRPGDYRITLSGTTVSEQPPQQLQGTLDISTGLPAPLDTASVQISGRIISSIECSPPAILLGEVKRDSNPTATLQLQDRRGHPLLLTDYIVRDDAVRDVTVVEVTDTSGSSAAGNTTLSLDIRFSVADLSQSESHSTVITICTSEGTIDVPVVWSGG